VGREVPSRCPRSVWPYLGKRGAGSSGADAASLLRWSGNQTITGQVTALQEAVTAAQTKNPALAEQATTDFVNTQPYLQTISDAIQQYK